MIWKEIPDLQALKRHLVNVHTNNQLPHALLFKEDADNAALALALGFVQYLYCDQPQDIYSCGECKSCKQTQNLFYPGFKLVMPSFSTSSQKEEAKENLNIVGEFYRLFKENIFVSFDDVLREVKGKNKQALISVQNIHDIIQSVSYSAVGDKYNIVCIWHPEMMAPAAANKLLKTLEEPPSQTIFVLVSSKPDELLSTILSRLQQIYVPSFSEKDIIDYLIQKYNTDASKAQEIAEICNGNINKAIHILNHFDDYLVLLNDFRTFAKLALKYDVNGIEAWIKKYETEGREALKKFLEYSLDIFHYALLQNYQLDNRIRATKVEKDFISKFYLYAHQDNIPKLYEVFNETYHDVTRNANIRITLNYLFLRCNELLKKKAVV